VSNPTRRAAISFAGVTATALFFVAALFAHLAITTPRAEATPACVNYWYMVSLAQADQSAAFETLTDAQMDWSACEAETPGNCLTEYPLVGYAEADVEAAEEVLSEAIDDAVECEVMNMNNTP
jgi:hypothetical protein